MSTNPSSTTSAEEEPALESRHDLENQSNKESFFKSSLHQYLFVFLVALSQMSVSSGIGTPGLIIQQIKESLGVDSQAEASWFLAAYSLTSGTFVLASGELGRIFGHKEVYVFGWFWLGIWNLVSAVAPSSIVFDLSRGLAGLGVALQVPNGLALLGLAFPPHSKAKNVAFAITGFLAPSGYNYGGLIGSLFVQLNGSWRGAFYFWLIFCEVVAILSFFFIPSSIGAPDKTLPLKQRISEFDFIGTFFGCGFLLLLSISWNQAGVVGWSEPVSYILLLISLAVFLPIFIFSQSRVKNPILPLSVWTRKGVVPVILAMLAGWASFGIFLYYTTTFILIFRKVTPLAATAELVPLVVGGLVATGSVPILMAKGVSSKYIFSASMFSFFLGNLLGSIAAPEETYWRFTFPSTALVPFGPDLSFASAGLIISNAVLPHEQGTAGSLVGTVVGYGMSIGLGIAATVESNVNKGGSDILRGFRGAFYLGIGLAALAFLIAVFTVSDVKPLVEREASQEKQEVKERIELN